MQAPPRANVGIALRRALYTFRQVLAVELRPLNLSLPLAGILIALVDALTVAAVEEERMLSGFSPRERQQLLSYLERCVDGLGPP